MIVENDLALGNVEAISRHTEYSAVFVLEDDAECPDHGIPPLGRVAASSYAPAAR
jgi:hypothetical protein